jgi:tetratricopeptide (TPR) repeat protein
VVAQRAGTPPPSPVLLAGIVPPLADSYYQRPETGLALRGGLYPGDTVVLTHGGQTALAPAAQGGTGKTQLAVAYTHALWSIRAVEVLIWVTASSRDAIITGYAEAAGVVGGAGHGSDAEAAAERFVAWIARTRHPWALILDDLSDPDDLADLWPAGTAGQVVITTRLPGDALTAAAAAPGLRIAPVGAFNRREALSYLTARLTDYPDQRMEALELGEDLGGLPLSLAQAAGAMKVTGLSCRQYRVQLAGRREHMSGAPVEGVSASVLATWSLAAECAHRLPPAGLAWPALALAAMLDPHGIPGAVLTSPAACGYIMGRPSAAGRADQDAVRAAVTNLARSGLVSIDPASPVRTVRMHPSVQAAVRAYLPPADHEQALLAAADALIQAWPESGAGAQLEQALRDAASALWRPEGPARHAAGSGLRHPLWQPEAHPLLFRRGISLEDSGLSAAAIAYWQAMFTTSTRRLGTGHANAVVARDRLAAAYESAGRFVDAIATFQQGIADRERSLGPEHPDTIRARAKLAAAYQLAGRPADAIKQYGKALADGERYLGPDHPVTRMVRENLRAARPE